ncbi:MAG: (Fe-S)-binding protein [Thiotrichales bacterium]
MGSMLESLLTTDTALALGLMAALGIVLASLLAIANRFLYVWEDPRIDTVDELLPHANCGACGEPGCRIFAEKLIAGTVEPAQCTVNSKEGNTTIAAVLGVELGDREKRVARLACAGGRHVAWMRATYAGLKSCRAAAVVSGGGKGCAWGCLGLADCAEVCTFNAITMNAFGLPVVDEDLCTACGDCVDVCPKNLFELHGVSHRLWVACKNEQFGDAAEAECEVACTACERCVVDSPAGLIHVRHNLAVVDYARNEVASKVSIQRCPTGAIVWLESRGQVEKGPKAKPILRKDTLPVG